MKTIIVTGLTLLIIWALLAIAQLWVAVLPTDVFIKLNITCAVLIFLLLIVTLVVREYLADKELKSKGFLDD